MTNNRTKMFFGAFAALTLALGVALLLSLTSHGNPQSAYAQAAATAEPATITVSGVGEIMVAPDIVTASFTVSTTYVEPATALVRNNATTEAVITAIKAQGVAEVDVRTSNFSVWPNTSWMDNAPRVENYTASNTITVTIRDIDDVGDILGAATAAGATSTGGVQFGITDSSAAYNQALALAVESATGKAEAIAEASGGRLGAVISVTENWGHNAPVARSAGIVAEMSMSMDDGFSVPVQAGELSVRANVQVVFALR